MNFNQKNCWYKSRVKLHNLLHAAHIGFQNVRESRCRHRRWVIIIFHDSHKRTPHRNTWPVKRMNKFCVFCSGAFKTGFHTTGIEYHRNSNKTKSRDIYLVTELRLDVIGFTRSKSHIARTQNDCETEAQFSKIFSAQSVIRWCSASNLQGLTTLTISTL